MLGIAVGLTIALTPPQVVKTIPAHGDISVDPDLTTLTVVFDQNMSHAAYSFPGGGPSFPNVTAMPKWLDARTCVVGIELEPDHDYSLAVNSDRHQGFKNESGEAAVPYPIVFATVPDRVRSPLTPETERLNLESLGGLRRAIDRAYSYRDRLGLDWDAEFARHEKALAEARSPKQFVRHAARLLSRAEDSHIWIDLDGQITGTHQREFQPNINVPQLARELGNWNQIGNNVASSTLEDGTLYVLIASFARYAEGEIENAAKLIEQSRDAPAIIIDVRPNSGGDEMLARRVASLFNDKARVYAKHVNRTKDGFSPPFERVLQAAKSDPYLKPVCVLMGPANMSSCDAFLLMMRQLPNARLIGERSYGSSGNPKPHELANGVKVYLPSWRAMDENGVVFEGVGIEPHIRVQIAPGELAERDPVVARAIEDLRARR